MPLSPQPDHFIGMLRFLGLFGYGVIEPNIDFRNCRMETVDQTLHWFDDAIGLHIWKGKDDPQYDPRDRVPIDRWHVTLANASDVEILLSIHQLSDLQSARVRGRKFDTVRERRAFIDKIGSKFEVVGYKMIKGGTGPFESRKVMAHVLQLLLFIRDLKVLNGSTDYWSPNSMEFKAAGRLGKFRMTRRVARRKVKSA